ncbi:hypothetical protein Cgig2_016568 [Carnegiea gigantea]|uniref:Uncharacterized protein n=1 Tax=Carnegiea gigantea TaxID=171969 RepID=A0A9Q1KYD2_9CARY|nr:hypothetical protein Cgig2_016568 [Carnegiea gigantea]
MKECQVHDASPVGLEVTSEDLAFVMERATLKKKQVKVKRILQKTNEEDTSKPIESSLYNSGRTARDELPSTPVVASVSALTMLGSDAIGPAGSKSPTRIVGDVMRRESPMHGFKEVVDRGGHDIGPKGHVFTWERGEVREKLNRFLGDFGWCSIFPYAIVSMYPWYRSNYNVILLDTMLGSLLRMRRGHSSLSLLACRRGL